MRENRYTDNPEIAFPGPGAGDVRQPRAAGLTFSSRSATVPPPPHLNSHTQYIHESQTLVWQLARRAFR